MKEVCFYSEIDNEPTSSSSLCGGAWRPWTQTLSWLLRRLRPCPGLLPIRAGVGGASRAGAGLARPTPRRPRWRRSRCRTGAYRHRGGRWGGAGA